MGNTLKKSILIINGPNLNLLGQRLPKLYGSTTLDELENNILKYYNNNEVEFIFFQSNHEGDIIDKMQQFSNLAKAKNNSKDCGIIINAGAYAHYSYAIRDTIEAISIPVIEVHISNVKNREEFRKKLVFSEVCKKTISGKGLKGYFEAIDFILN